MFVPSRAIAATIQVQAGDSLQPALDAAQPGDLILLQAGATFVGNFVLPAKPGAAFITIRSAASDISLPVNGQRIGPKWASLLPKLQSPNAMTVLRTAAGSHHWRLQFLEFVANEDGFGDLIQLGDGSSRQNTLAEVPHDIELDRVYIHGDTLVGQKRCVALNASAITIRSSFISDCKAVGQESQAIGGWNGPGPYWIEDNYLEGAGENLLFGGSDPSIPGLIATNITVRRNHISKPVAWRNPIIPTPAGLTATAGAGGTLPLRRITYRVVARRSVGQGAMGRSTVASVAVSVPANGKVQLKWSAVPFAKEYQVFARGFSWTVSGPAFVDTGAAGTAAAAPLGAGTTWLVKNLFELKNARRVTVEYNVFESNWPDGQNGYAILLTPRNSGGTCTWCVVQDVVFQFNIVRHTAAGVNLLGYDSPGISAQATNIRIRHNLFYDVSTAHWGGNGWFVLIGNEPRNVIVDHNTIDHDGSAVVYVYGSIASRPRTVLGFQFSNNLARHKSYGIAGDSYAFGNEVIRAYFPDGIVTHNLLAGGPADQYPPNNYFSTDFPSLFLNQSAGDYRLTPTSFARGRASDGENLGADMNALLAGINGVVTAVPPAGQPRVSTPLAPHNFRIIR
jgi:hypothetical protein